LKRRRTVGTDVFKMMFPLLEARLAESSRARDD
jgi:hypothetical protein